MKEILQKIKDNRGESLLELLVSILIGSMSVILLTTMIITSVRINSDAKKKDNVFYESLSAAESQQGTAVNSQLKIEASHAGSSLGSKTINISCYGKDGLYSYKKR